MTKITIEMEFDLDEFDFMSKEEQFETIETVLADGADANNADIKIKSIQIAD